ncbi:methyltransferase domain-containing protein [Thioalkalicoccus limnaeus]|uniref:Methyltransferase domain-containing protein n=1 Tax=Thioalkalicoccus limnaeus TaxID=120681 RepID=A0ABV4BJ08_9GAMM
MSVRTLDYYDQHAAAFFADTIDVDMSPLQEHFLRLLPDRARILDAGCGSGRDAKCFADRGYRVTAFDASPKLVALAASHLGQPVHCLRFQDLSWEHEFDGIWASASLLHVPIAELPDVLRRLTRALKRPGVLYASFKYGQGEREHRGRRFTDLDEPGLAALLRHVPDLEPVRIWSSTDRRPGREAERWLNTILRTTGSTWVNS